MPDSALPRRPLHMLAALLAAAALALPAAAEPPILTPDGGRYSGPLREGRLHGRGLIEWNSGARYEGEFEAGQISGQGEMRLPDGSLHRGQFRQGALNGTGRLESPDGTRYEGEFRHGLPHGQGRLEGPDGRYQGAFREGRFEGHGELQFPDGARYAGDFHLGRMHGQGRYQTPQGEVYEGGFVDGRFSGRGVMSRGERMRHEGEFLNWRPHGPGRHVDAVGTIYEGRFEQGELKGAGSVTRPGQGVYQGELRNWRAHGQGRLRLDNGDVYEGRFADGVYDGPGTLSYAAPREDGPQQLSGRWQGGELVDSPEARSRLARFEAALYSERERLERALAALAPHNPAAIDLYLLSVAGDGSQEVFRREAEFVQQQFDRDFGTRGRSLALVNSRSRLGGPPMASATSLRAAIEAMAARMDREQDILFLYLTSHGSPQHEFSLTQDDFDLPDLTAPALAAMLREAGIRWRVIVVSACYSGGFIDALRDPQTLVITAARHDRRSFGCADENDFTYFGRAFFKDALPGARSFQEAFRKAERLVRSRELEMLKAEGGEAQAEFSLPQMRSGAAIEARLAQWQRGLRAVSPRATR